MRRPFTILSGILEVLGWFSFFGPGLFIASKPHRDILLQGFQWNAFLFSLITYTPTNVAVLRLLAAFTGGGASRAVITGETAPFMEMGDKEGLENSAA